MDQCCIHSFVLKGIREGFRTSGAGDRHTCETCHQTYELQRAPNQDVPSAKGYTWQPVTH